MQIQEISSDVKERPKRDALLQVARRREVETVFVWRLDRWGPSVEDLVRTLRELQEVGVGFVPFKEALDLTTPTGRAIASLLAVFAEFEREILRARVKAGIAHARQAGKLHGRPQSAIRKSKQVKQRYAKGLNKSEIARRVGIGRTSVRRILPTPAQVRLRYKYLPERSEINIMISYRQVIYGYEGRAEALTVNFLSLTPAAPKWRIST